jgi:hypothetical protein
MKDYTPQYQMLAPVLAQTKNPTNNLVYRTRTGQTRGHQKKLRETHTTLLPLCARGARMATPSTSRALP